MTASTQPGSATSGIRYPGQEDVPSSWQRNPPVRPAAAAYPFGLAFLALGPSAIAAALLLAGSSSTTPVAAQSRAPIVDYTTYGLVGRRLRLTRREMRTRAVAILRQAEAYRNSLVEIEARLNSELGDVHT